MKAEGDGEQGVYAYMCAHSHVWDGGTCTTPTSVSFLVHKSHFYLTWYFGHDPNPPPRPLSFLLSEQQRAQNNQEAYTPSKSQSLAQKTKLT